MKINYHQVFLVIVIRNNKIAIHKINNMILKFIKQIKKYIYNKNINKLRNYSQIMSS